MHGAREHQPHRPPSAWRWSSTSRWRTAMGSRSATRSATSRRRARSSAARAWANPSTPAKGSDAGRRISPRVTRGICAENDTGGGLIDSARLQPPMAPASAGSWWRRSALMAVACGEEETGDGGDTRRLGRSYTTRQREGPRRHRHRDPAGDPLPPEPDALRLPTLPSATAMQRLLRLHQRTEGGVYGRKIRFIVGDDHYNPPDAAGVRSQAGGTGRRLRHRRRPGHGDPRRRLEVPGRTAASPTCGPVRRHASGRNRS